MQTICWQTFFSLSVCLICILLIIGFRAWKVIIYQATPGLAQLKNDSEQQYFAHPEFSPINPRISVFKMGCVYKLLNWSILPNGFCV